MDMKLRALFSPSKLPAAVLLLFGLVSLDQITPAFSKLTHSKLPFHGLESSVHTIQKEDGGVVKKLSAKQGRESIQRKAMIANVPDYDMAECFYEGLSLIHELL